MASVRGPIRGRALAGVVLLIMTSGCYQADPLRRQRLERGCVLILTGVECYAAQHAGLARGLRERGEDRAIQIEEWGYKPFGTLPNLLSYQLNRQRAAGLAARLVKYRASYPEGEVTIIGFSGGGAMALFTAEALPADFQLDRIILLGAAVSPTYPLEGALARCKRGIVNFYSPYDWFMDGWATKTFGTMDRVKTDAAGRIGFRGADGEMLKRDGLTQIKWRPAWRRLGHLGFHAGWRSRAWAREVLAAYVNAPVERIAQE